MNEVMTAQRAGRQFSGRAFGRAALAAGLLTAGMAFSTGAAYAQDTTVFRAEEPSGFGGYVWMDSNNNGTRDQGEPGAAAVGVSVLVPAESPGGESFFRTTTTDADGHWTVEGVPTNGTATVEFTAPAGYAFTRQDAAIATGHFPVDSSSSWVNKSGVVNVPTGYPDPVNVSIGAGLIPASLAATGADPLPAAIGAATLVGAGAAMIVAVRRRRHV